MNGNALFFARGRQRNANRPAGSIDAVHQSAEAVSLPFFAVAGLFFSNVRFLHGDNRHGQNGFSILGKLAAHKNAVAGLNVRQLDGRGFLQVLLPGRNSNEFRGVLDLDGHVASRICRQRYGFAGDRLNCSDGPRRGGSLRGRLLPRLGLGRLRTCGASRAEIQANRCDQQC